MAPFGIVYSYIPNPRVLKIEAAAKVSGLEVIRDPNFVTMQTNKTDAFKAKFHNTSVPAFETADGSVALSDSDAIVQFIAEKATSPDATTQLLGGGKDCPVARARVRQWIGFSNDVLGIAYRAAMPRMGMCKYDAETEEFVLNILRSKFDTLNGWLETKEKEGKWVADTEKLSLADIALVTSLMIPFGLLCDEEFRKGIPVVVAYFNRVKEAPEVKSVFENSFPLLDKLQPVQ